ncbi:MAG TPA: hypothetical protein VFW98_12540 [Gemmatimonadaceae bacterium]|nr:hypothetical protein [Gemmatimonadaceae bacterium]
MSSPPLPQRHLLDIAHLVSGFLYGVSPADPLTLIAVALVLMAVALLASAIPARRAAAANPMASLRVE